MDGHEPLEALERDLDVVGRRLANDRPWNPSAWRVRWSLHEPLRRLLWTSALIAAAFWLGTRNGHSWMSGVGLILIALPGRVAKLRERRAELAIAADGDLFELYRKAVEGRFASLFLGILFDLAVVLGSLLFALVAPDPRPALAIAGLFGSRAAYRAFVAVPRNLRDSRALRPADEPQEPKIADDDEDDDEDKGTLAGFVAHAIWYALVLFVYFAGPFVVLAAAIGAVTVEEPRGLWTLAAGMLVAWLAVLVWRRRLGDEDDEDDEDGDGDDEREEERP